MAMGGDHREIRQCQAIRRVGSGDSDQGDLATPLPNRGVHINAGEPKLRAALSRRLRTWRDATKPGDGTFARTTVAIRQAPRDIPRGLIENALQQHEGEIAVHRGADTTVQRRRGGHSVSDGLANEPRHD